jgi:predicted porin
MPRRLDASWQSPLRAKTAALCTLFAFVFARRNVETISEIASLPREPRMIKATPFSQRIPCVVLMLSAALLAPGRASADIPDSADSSEALPAATAPVEPESTATAPVQPTPTAAAPIQPAPPAAPVQPAPPAAPVQPSPVRTGAIHTQIYGFLNAEVERVWAKGGSTPYDPRFRVTDGNSRLGFSGTVDLTENTQALWQIEGALNGFEQGGLSDQGTTAVIVSRNTFVGVSDRRFGRLVLGNNDSAYRTLVGSGGAMGGNIGLSRLGLDLWNNTSAQLTGGANNLFSRGEARYKNSAHYQSPEWNLGSPFVRAQLASSYGIDELLGNGRHRDRFSVAALLGLGAFQLGGGIDYQSNTGINVDDLQQGLGLHTDSQLGVATYFYKVVASFLFPTKTYVGVGVERANYGFLEFIPPSPASFYATRRSSTLHQNGAMASFAQGVGRATLMVSAGALLAPDSALAGSVGDFRATQLSAGAKYAFNDLFGAYAYFTSIRNRAQQDINLGMPVYSNALGTSKAFLAPGDSPNAVGIGVIARF